jgi:phosphatidylglycerol:prolipoprotein diacylglycerol transferase
MYFAFSNLIIFVTLLALRRYRKFHGQLAALYFIMEGAFRMVLETWRGDIDRGFWLGLPWLSTGRLTALIFILIGAGIWFLSAKAVQKTNQKANT